MSKVGSSVHVLYATATGTAEDVAYGLAELLISHGVNIRSCSTIDDYDISKLPLQAAAGHYFVFVVATCGDGEVPANMRKFWRFICRVNLPNGVLRDLRFAVFGLGDRAYVKFNAAARKLSLRLSDLGASPIIPIALGDESAQGGYDKELSPWTNRLCRVVAPSYRRGEEESASFPVKEPRIVVTISDNETTHGNSDLWKKGQARCPWKHSSALLFEADVLRNEIITKGEYLTDNKEVRHLVLDISKAHSSTGLLEYVPGDIVHVMPRNRDSAVDAFFKLTGFNENALLNINESRSKTRFGSYQLNINLPCSLRDFVSAQLDLTCIPRRTFFERLAPFATDPMHRDKLMELGSAEGADMLTQYAYREKRSILMVLRDFPSARPPLDHLFDMIPILKSRPFSIASSVQAHHGEIHICASIVQYITPLRFSRVGVCSSFFRRVSTESVIPIFLEKGTSLRFRTVGPSIMIGPGTGVAPMRSFLSFVASTDHQTSERILFFGCRRKIGDFLYEQEWEDFLKSEHLSALFTAFSREKKEEKVYVQHRLREYGEKVWELISQDDCHVYVAGASGGMPKDVRRELVDICSKVGKLTEADAEQFVRKMETVGRLQMETW